MNRRLGLVSENTGAIARPLRVDIRKKNLMKNQLKQDTKLG